MKLSEFTELLTKKLDRVPLSSRGDPDVVVRTMNCSMGPVAVTHLSGGMDWDADKFFLCVEPAVVKATVLDRDELLTCMAKHLEFLTKRDYLPRQRKHCWEEGFKEGAQYGVSKLAEENRD